MRKRFWDLERSTEVLRVEHDTLVKRVKNLEWFDREMRKKQGELEAAHKLYRTTAEAKFRQLERDLENARGETMDAREEVKLSDITIEGLNATIGDLRKQLVDLEEEKGKSDKKVEALVERERREVSKFMLFERIRMVKEFQAGGSVNWDLKELEQEFQDEGYSMPSPGDSDEESGGEEEVNSLPEMPGSDKNQAPAKEEGTGDSHEVGGDKASGKDA